MTEPLPRSNLAAAELETLKGRVIATAPDGDIYTAPDLGNVCLIVSAAMFKANGVTVEAFVDGAREAWNRCHRKEPVPAGFSRTRAADSSAACVTRASPSGAVRWGRLARSNPAR